MLRALTIYQPWAWAIIHGPKRIENRTWRTHYRGPLVIHAGKKRRSWLVEKLPDGTPVPELDRLTFRAVLGLVDVVDCVELAQAPARIRNDPFAVGPFCWILENPRALSAPIECRGGQILWKLPPAIETILLKGIE